MYQGQNPESLVWTFPDAKAWTTTVVRRIEEQAAGAGGSCHVAFVMGSPKRRLRTRGPLWRRCFYRFIYVVLLVASAYFVLAQFRSRLAPSTTEHLARLGTPDADFLIQSDRSSYIPVRVVAAHHENRTQLMQRWIERPDSLCYGIGNVTILSITPGLPQVFLEQLRKNRLGYAYKHGYRYCEVSTVLDLFSPVPWTKTNALMLVLSFADVVVHMHPDALIHNLSVTIESIINTPDYNLTTKDVIYSSDFSGGREVQPSMSGPIDTGVFIVRSTMWSKAYLEVMCKYFRTSLFFKLSEDDAIQLYREKHFDEFSEHIAIIPFWHLNSPCGDELNHYRAGDFVARYWGIESKGKYERLAAMLSVYDKILC